ncbi:hypothetical protein ES703_68661 [subsurface metagenome]
MPRTITDGLSSAYQVTEYTATSELGYNLPDTGGMFAIPVLEIVDEKELAKLAEAEIISIRISPEHEGMAFYLLSKISQFQSLPDHIYTLRKSDLRLLEEAGIPYEKVR